MIQITDHALVGYLERLEGVDIEKVCQTIAQTLGAPLAKRLIEFSGDAKCRIKAGNAIYCMCGETVTTCIDRRRRPQ